MASMIEARWNPDSLLPNCQSVAQWPCRHNSNYCLYNSHNYNLLIACIHTWNYRQTLSFTNIWTKVLYCNLYLPKLMIYWLFTFVIGSCLEEGAEEFLLKPVKLSDVKRVTDFIMKGEGKKRVKKSHKRSRSDDCTPPSISTAFSSVSHPCEVSLPASPSTFHSKKSRLSI